ncbi:protein Shroom1 [Serinus canaria]|nr:protein Shroom1 [Serinus canaria]XP_018770886.3 protein Shroom1 [Serinus canaria]XP_030085216.2 protein Shroom1 [Serinus canaria]XP_030085217.2 protein Shroom1 [Serinus canaria]XP_050835731.1 protein Shroom1 [Serinus canaria]
MTSAGNEVERWTLRQGGRAGKLVEPVASPESDHLLSVKSVSSMDHLLHLPGRADSAYSSFSGGSNVPEYPTASCHSECFCVPPEQAPYMDSEYVTGIYNLSAAHSAPRSPQPSKAPELSSPNSSHSCGVTPAQRSSNQGPAALAAALLCPPVCPGSCSITSRLLEMPGERKGSAGHTEGSVQPAPGVQHSQPAGRERPRSQHWDALTEQGVGPPREKPLENKGLPSDFTKVSKVQPLKTEGNGEWSPSQQPTKRSNPHVFRRPSSFIFQEYLKTDSAVNVPKILSAYNSGHGNKIPKEMNCRSYHQAHSKPSAVNDTREVKQCPRGVCKPGAREAALPSTVPGPSQRKESLPCAQGPLHAEWHSDMDQDVFEDSSELKYMENALLNKTASRKLNSYADKNQCYDSEGKIISNIREPVPSQQNKVQRSALSCSCNAVEVEHPQSEELGQGRRQCCDGTGQRAFSRPREESTSQSFHEVQKGKQGNSSSPDLSRCVEQEEPPVQKQQPAFQTQLSRQLREDPAGEQITRQATPMLYYLSAGKTTHVQHPSKDSRSSAKEIPSSSCAASAECLEIQREGHQLQRSSHHQQHSADDLQLQNKDLILRSPASFTEESFQNDYIEKLKVAQKKVLKETSFKRKDLQMSLPVRLRQKSSKRPSVEHLRSLSLSSASEDAKPVPCSPSHLESLESFNRNEEIRRPQKGQAGGRKRVTQEQKKLCYSEPEKLNHLMDKEVPWSQVRDETTEQGTVASRRRDLENRGKAFSSSNVSRTELKQIQHSALIKYMERKISQRPGGSQHLPLHKPALQERLSNPKGPPGQISNPGGSRKMQNDEVFCQLLSEQKSPDVFPPLPFAPPLNMSSRCDPNQGDGSCTSKCPSAESLPQTGGSASGRAPERPKSTPSSTQDPCRCARCAAAPCRRRGSCPGTSSFHDPEKDGPKSHEHIDITGCGCGQDKKEQSPETPIPVPRDGSKEGAGVEEECRTQSVGGNAALKHPEQQQPATSPEQGMHLHTAPAQPHQGHNHPAKGLLAQETSMHSSHGGVPLEGDTHLPRRRLQQKQDQRYQELALEIIAKDSSLVDILMPQPLRKTALDLMEGLFPVNISMLDKSRRKRGKAQRVQENDKKSHGDGPEECPKSEHETKQRSKYPASMRNKVLKWNRDSTNELDDITSKKLELMASLQSRLQALWEEQELVLLEVRECAKWGEELEVLVRDLCKPQEFERYLMFIGDLEKVLSLLLCLSSRLARVQNALSRMDGNTEPEEKQSLDERHKLLSRQREDAKDLKENLDRRERVVSGILAKYLTEQQLQDYQHFVQVKTSLLIEQKDLEEQIKFFEEQLENLEQSIPI